MAAEAGCGGAGLHRNVGEPDFAQAGLGRDAAPGGADRQLDVLRLHRAEVDGGVGGVSRGPGALGEFGHVGHRRPRGAVGRRLDRHLLGAQANETLDQLVGVPHLQRFQSVDLVELVLDPVRQHAGAHPHRGRLDAVQVAGHAGAVDGLLRSHAGCGAGGGSRGGPDPIAVGLHGERPDRALEDVVGRLVDLIDPPVVRLPIGEQPHGVRRGVDATLVDAGRVGGRRRLGHRGHIGPEIHIVLAGGGSGHPAQGHIARHIRGAGARRRIGGRAGHGHQGVAVVVVGGHIIGVIRPHEDIPEHGGVGPFPAKDIHVVLAVPKLFGVAFRVIGSAPAPRGYGRLKDPVAGGDERRCAIPGGKGRARGNRRTLRVALDQQEVRPVVRIEHSSPKVPGAALAAGGADIERPAHHAAGGPRAAYGFAEGPRLINHRRIVRRVGIALIEILGLEPDLVPVAVVGDLEVLHRVGRQGQSQRDEDAQQRLVFPTDDRGNRGRNDLARMTVLLRIYYLRFTISYFFVAPGATNRKSSVANRRFSELYHNVPSHASKTHTLPVLTVRPVTIIGSPKWGLRRAWHRSHLLSPRIIDHQAIDLQGLARLMSST